MAVTWVVAVMAGMMAGQLRHTVGAAPLLAALLWAACCLRSRDLVIIGVGATVVGDLTTGISWFTLVRLAAVFGVIGIIRLARVRPSFRSVLVGLGLSSPVYHVVLAAGDWLTRTCTVEPMTMDGLLRALASSLPYAQRSFMGELAFTALFLGLYALAGFLVRLRWPSLLPQPSTK